MPTSTPLKITWIAPEVPFFGPLAYLQELGNLARIPNVALKPVTGQVTRDHIATALGERTDVILWSGHGEPGGLCIPPTVQGERYALVRPKWLAMQAHCALPKLLILAACSSQLRDEHLRSMVEEVARAGVNVIGFPALAQDNAVIAFNVELVRALAQGARMGDAYDVALEGISHYETAKGIFWQSGWTNGYRDVADRLQSIEERLTNIETIIKAPKARARKPEGC